MRKYPAVFMVVLGFLFLSGCKGDMGPAGASGTIFEKNFQYGLLPDIYYSLSYDAHIVNGIADDNNYGGCSSMSVGTIGGITSRTLIKFNLNTFTPADAKVDKAYLSLRVSNVGNQITITAYALEEIWYAGLNCGSSSSGDASWNNFNPVGGHYNPLKPVSNSVVKTDTALDAYDPVRFELNAAMVQDWISNPVTNYGVIIVSSDETVYNSFLGFYTNENSMNYSYSPKLTIFYELP